MRAHIADLRTAINRPETEVVLVGLPNYVHQEAVAARAAEGRAR